MQSFFSSLFTVFVKDGLLSLSRFVAFFCQDDFDRLDRGVTFCHKRTGRFSFSSALGRVLMEMGMGIRSGRGHRVGRDLRTGS
jgi:hypothetical protein